MLNSITNTLAIWTPGGPELIVILVIAVLLFGRRLPEIARGMGKSITEFKKGVKEGETEVTKAIEDNDSEVADSDQNDKTESA